jgi:light-regulated signal transduction histidine kinase (bacteriophytochrome)
MDSGLDGQSDREEQGSRPHMERGHPAQQQLGGLRRVHRMGHRDREAAGEGWLSTVENPADRPSHHSGRAAHPPLRRHRRHHHDGDRTTQGPRRVNDRCSGTNVDITERKQAEETLRELNEELNEYAYALTHNLKAPLRAIHNYVNFLFEDLADNLQGKPKKYLQGIKDAITSSNKQFEDLERLYHIKNHLLNFESFEMCELLDEINSLFKDTSTQNFVIAQNWPRFRSERFLLRQILLALINNGLKFNDEDIKRIEIGWQAVADHGIEIFVRDNGIGIDPQYQQQIFDIFRRLHTESEYEGTGIGLAVVKRAVQRIGGKLRLESAVGEGSTFYINLPNSLIENNQA